MRLPAAAFAALASAGLAACGPQESGYVEIRLMPGFMLAPLYLNASKLDAIKNGVTIVREHVGKASLQIARNRGFVRICDFEVRQNRIVTVTVSSIERTPSCDVQN
jgi:hypothetical protein